MRPLPKRLEKLAMHFPIVHLLGIAAALTAFIILPGLASGVLLVLTIYFFPVLLWRLARIFFPIRIGVSFLGVKEKEGCSWILAHRLQYVFITFPVFERILIIIPGAYSAWLRLWGSKIGKSVVWTPRIDVVDRTHLEIGDYCFIGDKTYLSSHFIKRKDQRLALLFKPVVIEERSLIGYSCVLGPGTLISKKTSLPAMSRAMLGRIAEGAEWI